MSNKCMLCWKELNLKSRLMIDADLCKGCHDLLEDCNDNVIVFPSINGTLAGVLDKNGTLAGVLDKNGRQYQ
ncbi:MAG: hypothetical protein ACW98I_19590 [Candidatus Hodarchaeales archaeon]